MTHPAHAHMTHPARELVTRPLEEKDDVRSATEPVAEAGHFRIYLGAAAGVGKTMAMLDEAHRRLDRGTDVVIGLVETHHRPNTMSRAEGLEAVPTVRVVYRGSTFQEMDAAGVLTRAPKVVLVDELAHTNVPGSGPHIKRWQDVLEILDAGIDVISTLNVQHIESIADTVEEITGAAVRERVPDWVVRRADQIELVDSSPEQLRRRMEHGNIYPRDKVPAALANFFRTDNLAALRELALRFVADDTDQELMEKLRRRHPSRVWETKERILVAVTAAPGTDAIIRRAARIAQRVDGDLHVATVLGTEDNPADRDPRLEELEHVATDVGAAWHEMHHDDPVAALLDLVEEFQITQLVVGSRGPSVWHQRLRGAGFIERVSRGAADKGVDLHVIARRGNRSRGKGSLPGADDG